MPALWNCELFPKKAFNSINFILLLTVLENVVNILPFLSVNIEDNIYLEAISCLVAIK